jgi:hypothetical protein
MQIPAPVIAVVSDVLAERYTHSRIDYFIGAAGLEGERLNANKIDKVREWLRRANAGGYDDPLAILGRVINELMEVDFESVEAQSPLEKDRARVNKVLGEQGLGYVRGGRVVVSGVTEVSKSIEEHIKAAGVTLTVGTMDVPVSATVCEIAGAATFTRTRAVLIAGLLLGVNVTLMVQLPPTARPVPPIGQFWVSPNRAGLVPPRRMLVIQPFAPAGGTIRAAGVASNIRAAGVASNIRAAGVASTAEQPRWAAKSAR